MLLATLIPVSNGNNGNNSPYHNRLNVIALHDTDLLLNQKTNSIVPFTTTTVFNGTTSVDRTKVSISTAARDPYPEEDLFGINRFHR